MSTRAEALQNITEIINEHGFAPIACSSCGSMSETRDAKTLENFKKFARGTFFHGTGLGVRCGSCSKGIDMAFAFEDTIKALS